MGLETNISVVALAISLIALFLTSIQLLQQLFATGDGFRRCQDSVISLWSKEVKWRWRSTELRFETQYKTPHFTTKEIRTPRDAEADIVDPPSWYRWIFLGFQGLFKVFQRFELDIVDYLESRNRSTMDLDEKDEEVPKIAIVGSKNSKAATRTPQNDDKGKPLKDDTAYFFEHPDLVDWLNMLHQLHLWTDRALLADREPGPPTHDHRPVLVWNKDNQAHLSVPAIIPRLHSWDLVPPDVVRPLATSTVGDIIVLAGRMQLRWIEPSASEGKMRAEGDHRSLTQTQIRGLGIVLSFNCTRSDVPTQDPVLVPSTECDKLRCGIIPGNEEMVPRVPEPWCISMETKEAKRKELVEAYSTRDYPLVTTKYDMTGVATLLEDIGVTREAQEELLNRETRHKFESASDVTRLQQEFMDLLPGFSDVFTMLTPFMPLKDSRIVKVQAPLAEDFGSPCTRRAGHIVLWRRLKSRLEQPGEQDPELRKVFNHLNDLKNTYPWKFHQRLDLGQNLKLGTREVPMVEALRDINHDTTEYFRNLHEQTLGQAHEFKFLDLVAAHVSVAAVKARKKHDKPEGVSGPSMVEVEEGPYGRWGPPMLGWIVDRCNMYADMVPEVVDEMLRRGKERHEEENQKREEGEDEWSKNGKREWSPIPREVLEAAWWRLMLRAFTWEMSVHVIYTVWEGRRPVPSEYYYSKVPVWLT